MKFIPHYDDPPLISIDGVPNGQLAPAFRQRRRMEALLASLDDEQWAAATRCENWDVADVVAHLITVNAFWSLSISRGLAGTPTRYLQQFDATVTPGELVAGARGTPPSELLDELIASNDNLLNLVGGLDDAGWSTLAECPVGHLPVRLVLQHSLWDGWVHERDVALPLGLHAPVESDEVISSLTYVSAITSAITIMRGEHIRGEFALQTNSPASRWIMDVTERVEVRPGEAVPATASLDGAAVDLVEALSLRMPLPPGAPEGWRHLLDSGLGVAFGDRQGQ